LGGADLPGAANESALLTAYIVIIFRLNLTLQGTGKTHVGSRLVAALLHNSQLVHQQVRPAMDFGIGEAAAAAAPAFADPPVRKLPVLPILLICYTNHALDSFLLDVVDKQHVPLTDIVRMGGRSKEERLMSRSLQALARDEGSDSLQERQSFGALRAKLDGIEAEMGDGIDKLTEKSGITDVIKWLGRRYPMFQRTLFPFVRRPEAQPQAPADWVDKDTSKAMLKRWLAGKAGAATTQQQQQAQLPANSLSNKEKQAAVAAAKAAAAAVAQRPARFLDELKRHPAHVLDCSATEANMLWDSWLDEYRREDTAGLAHQLERYECISDEIRRLGAAKDLRILRQAKIVAITTSGAAKYQSLLAALQPRIVLCEEAGEVLEAHVVASLTESTEHAIFIGDHQQLRPKLDVYRMTAAAGTPIAFDKSMFERLVSTHSPAVLSTMQTQRRMHPDISAILKLTLYPNLVDGANTFAHPPVRGMRDRTFFFDHNHPEGKKGDDSESKTNQFEADMIGELVKYLVRQGYALSEITVLSTYGGQLVPLKKALEQRMRIVVELSEQDQMDLEKAAAGDNEKEQNEEQGEEDEEEEEKKEGGEKKMGGHAPPTHAISALQLSQGIRIRYATAAFAVASVRSFEQRELIFALLCSCLSDFCALSSVDNFQGEEANIIILSTVRCNKDGSIGFLREDNRVNVMLSRAKHGMFVFGSAATIRAFRSRDGKPVMFQQFVEHMQATQRLGGALHLKCKQHGIESVVTTAQEFRRFSEEAAVWRSVTLSWNAGTPARATAIRTIRNTASPTAASNAADYCRALIRANIYATKRPVLPAATCIQR
jgi:hypothetical protein